MPDIAVGFNRNCTALGISVDVREGSEAAHAIRNVGEGVRHTPGAAQR